MSLSKQSRESLLDAILSITLVDDKKESIVDLIYIDDDTLVLDKELLEGLDKEMDDFLKHLLEE